MEENINQEHFCDPTLLLQDAIEQIEVFTKQDASRLEVKEDGKLIAAKASGLKKVMGLARNFVGPIFSDQVRQEQEKKLNQIKKEILNARDTIQSHSLLIEKWKEGSSAQRKLAQWALEAIKRYNAIVAQTTGDTAVWTSKYDFYNYERNQLLLDEDIKGNAIRLPHTVSIKYDSHPDSHLAQKSLKELGESLIIGAIKKVCSDINSIHKKTIQVMTDTFRMKAIRMIQSHLSHHSSLGEARSLVQQTSIEISEDSASDTTLMRQIIEIFPGSIITLTGSFKKKVSDSKLMSVPTLEGEGLRLSLQSIQTGFPYPSQYNGWTLADQLIAADPLRSEQVPLFHQIDERKKALAQALLFDQLSMAKAKQIYKLNKEVIDQDYTIFLDLHRELHEKIIQGTDRKEEEQERFDGFYSFVRQTSSVFDTLVQTQQKLLNLFIIQPTQKLHEAWLSGNSELRTGTYQDKYRLAAQLLKTERDRAIATLHMNNPIDVFITLMGDVLGCASQSIVLQHMSEKIGFAPPMLTDFEQKIQTCAFQQLLTFLEEFENQPENLSETVVKDQIIARFQADMDILQASEIDVLSIPASELALELEVYFNSRFYATNYKRQS